MLLLRRTVIHLTSERSSSVIYLTSERSFSVVGCPHNTFQFEKNRQKDFNVRVYLCRGFLQNFFEVQFLFEDNGVSEGGKMNRSNRWNIPSEPLIWRCF